MTLTHHNIALEKLSQKTSLLPPPQKSRSKQYTVDKNDNPKKYFFLLVIFFFSFANLFTQNISINTTGVAANASAILDVDATDKGMLIPRVSLISNTDVATIASPATSLLVFNTNASMTNGNGSGYYYWDGAMWLPIAMTSNSGGPCAPTQITNELSSLPTASTGTVCTTSACGTAKTPINCIKNCDNLVYNGFSDWRVPSTEELIYLLPIAPFNTSVNYIVTVSLEAKTAYGVVRLSDVDVTTSSSTQCRCVR